MNGGRTATPPSHQSDRRTIEVTNAPTIIATPGPTANVCQSIQRTMASLFSLWSTLPTIRSHANREPAKLRAKLRRTPAATAIELRNIGDTSELMRACPTVELTGRGDYIQASMGSIKLRNVLPALRSNDLLSGYLTSGPRSARALVETTLRLRRSMTVALLAPP